MRKIWTLSSRTCGGGDTSVPVCYPATTLTSFHGEPVSAVDTNKSNTRARFSSAQPTDKSSQKKRRAPVCIRQKITAQTHTERQTLVWMVSIAQPPPERASGSVMPAARAFGGDVLSRGGSSGMSVQYLCLPTQEWWQDEGGRRGILMFGVPCC